MTVAPGAPEPVAQGQAKRGVAARSPCRQPGRPRDPSVDEAILAAVVQLLGEGGPAGLSLDAVVARAGVSKASLYRRWSSKTELIVAAVAQEAAMLIPVVDTGSVRNDLIHLLGGFLDLLRGPQHGLVTALLAEVQASTPLGNALRVGLMVPRRQLLVAALERGIARGEVRADIDLLLVSNLLFGGLLHRAVFYGETGDPHAPRKLIETIFQGIAAPNAMRG